MSEETKSRLVVNFESVGSATFQIGFENVTPTQILALASYLELKAKNEIVQMENQTYEKQRQYDETHKLIVPETPDILIGKK